MTLSITELNVWCCFNDCHYPHVCTECCYSECHSSECEDPTEHLFLSVNIMRGHYAQGQCDECQYAECQYPKCHGPKSSDKGFHSRPAFIRNLQCSETTSKTE
jgi:hypothetical protein